MKTLMKHIPIFLLFFFVLISCNPTVDRGKEGEYFKEENGITYYKGSPFTGTTLIYHENGQLWSKKSYKEGKLDGVWEWYYENGQLWKKGSYKNGKLDGDWKNYNSFGQLERKATYKDGVEIE